MVVLAEYNTITEAEISKSMLDSAGIWSTIRNEYMSTIYPIGTMPAQLVVRESDLGKRPRPAAEQIAGNTETEGAAPSGCTPSVCPSRAAPAESG